MNGKSIPRFRSRDTAKLLSYAAMLVCDSASIVAAFSIAGQVRGHYWLQIDGTPVSLLFIAIYAIVAANIGAISRESFSSRLRSAAGGARAVAATCAIVTMILFFTLWGLTLSRLALGTAMVLSLILVGLGRVLLLSFFLPHRDALWDNTLFIVDGPGPHPDFKGATIDAVHANIRPDLRDPGTLERMGEAVSGFDKVVVACNDPSLRSAWAIALKSHDIHAELLHPEGMPIGSIGVGRFMGYDTLVVLRGRLSLARRCQKRIMDIIFSSIALVLLSPLLIAVALVIRLESKGPALFLQPRIGYGNRTFRICKFRSMRLETQDLAGSVSASRDDERITRIGRFIRRTSIDELPQLLNVLAGSMSLVGPRPHAPGSLAGQDLFWDVDNRYWLRHSLKPGMTGLAQIRGFRGSTHERKDLENRLRADFEYLENWSLQLDVRILLATVRVLVHQRAF